MFVGFEMILSNFDMRIAKDAAKRKKDISDNGTAMFRTVVLSKESSCLDLPVEVDGPPSTG